MTTQTTEEKKVAQEDLTIQLVRQTTGYHFGPQAPDDMDKVNNIVIAKNGIFRTVKTAVATFTTQIGTMKEGYTVPGIVEMKEGIELLIPKIPFKYWLQCLAWYKDVNDKDKTEASVLFFWNHDEIEMPTEYNNKKPITGLSEDGQLIIYVPHQKNSGGLSEFKDDDMVNWMRKNTTPLLETHSHNNMDAYFSGTDDANENMNQFYAVFGKVSTPNPAFAFRYCSGKHKVQSSPWDLFEIPNIRVQAQLEVDGLVYDIEAKGAYNGPWPKVPYPDSWMGQHSTTWKTVGNSGSYHSKRSWKDGAVWNYLLQDWEYPEDALAEKKTGTSALTTTSPTRSGGPSTGSTTSADTSPTTTDFSKKNPKRDVIETETSVVEIVADDLVSKFAREQIKDLVVHLCQYGYDFFIYEGIQEASV